MYYWKDSTINFVWVRVTWRSRSRWGFPKQVATLPLLARAKAQGQISVVNVFESLDRRRRKIKWQFEKNGLVCGDLFFSVWKVMFIPISLLFPLFIPFFLSQSLSFPFSPFNIFFTDLSQVFITCSASAQRFFSFSLTPAGTREV